MHIHPEPPRAGAAPAVSPEHYVELAKRLLRGRRFILVGGIAAGLVPIARHLRELGAERPFILAGNPGTGELPSADDGELHLLNLPQAPDMVAAMRRFESLLEDPPAPARAAIERWDPEARALGLGLIMLGSPRSVAGRRLYARRPPEFVHLESKVEIDAVWDSIGVARAPCQVVPIERAALARAARRLDRGLGTAWAGDNREGVHGGATLLRWVRDADSERESVEFFAAHCDRVRVMPFLEGIPCSIHAIAFPGASAPGDGIAVFRPCEMVTLRRPSGSRVLYAGSGTFWDPEPADREEMRAVARRVAQALRERVGFRGALTIDGIMTAEGFRPTELNPRFGAALGLIAAVTPVPLVPLALAALEGEALDYRAADLEALVLEAADRRRAGSGATIVPGAREKTESWSLVERDGGYRVARDGEEPDATFVAGPADAGSFVRFAPRADRVPAGPSFAPRVVAAFACADGDLGIGVGPVEPARRVR